MTNHHILSSNTLVGDKVVNGKDENLGKIEEIMLDTNANRIAYAVLSFGGVLGMGDKLFAVPWDALELDAENHRFRLDVPKEKLEKAPGFDKSDWPDFADPALSSKIYGHYGTPAYW